MSAHRWFQGILAPARELDDGKTIKSIGSPFLTCDVCHIQTHMIGYGKNGRLIYRQSSSHEWQFKHIECSIDPPKLLNQPIQVCDWAYLIELRKSWTRTGHKNVPLPEDPAGFLGSIK